MNWGCSKSIFEATLVRLNSPSLPTPAPRERNPSAPPRYTRPWPSGEQMDAVGVELGILLYSSRAEEANCSTKLWPRPRRGHLPLRRWPPPVHRAPPAASAELPHSMRLLHGSLSKSRQKGGPCQSRAYRFGLRSPEGEGCRGRGKSRRGGGAAGRAPGQVRQLWQVVCEWTC